MRFFNFLNFLSIFFGIFLPWSSINGIRDENFFFLFFGLSLLVLAKDNAGKGFFKFLNFFAFFFQNFLPRIVYERNSGLKIFFFYFSAYLTPFWLKIMLERGFLIFWIFLLFFSEFSSPGRVRTEFGTKFFFSLCPPISSRFS